MFQTLAPSNRAQVFIKSAQVRVAAAAAALARLEEYISTEGQESTSQHLFMHETVITIVGDMKCEVIQDVVEILKPQVHITQAQGPNLREGLPTDLRTASHAS